MKHSEWIKYIGSDEQIEEMLFAANKHGVMIIHHNGELCPGIFTDANELSQHLDKRTKYPIKMFWLCQPHPYADLIKIWADTGCPVWYRHKLVIASGECDPFHLPFSYPDICEYSLTPFED